MLWRTVLYWTGAALVGASFLVPPEVQAGDRVHAGDRYASRAPTAAAPTNVIRPASFSFVVTAPGQPTTEEQFVILRGPDGQVRRFPIEGGRAAIQVRQVVLRVGESVTIHWVQPK
jgi:hypothetical protein